jgi:hypothetical protein
LLGSFAKQLQKTNLYSVMHACLLVCLSAVCLSVFLSMHYTALTGQIFVKFYIGDFYSVNQFDFWLKGGQ